MPKSFNLILVLSIICIVSAASLSYVYINIAEPIIKERDKEAALKILNEMLPGADEYNFINDESTGKPLYYAAVKDDEIFGVAIPTAASGFGGPVSLMVISDMNGKISGVKVLGQTETPGYGDRIITEPWFIEQFIDMNLVNDTFEINASVDALAGATVTSTAAAKAVTKAAEFYQSTIMMGGSN